MSINKKIQQLNSKKEQIEQELFQLKQQNMQLLASALMHIESVNNLDLEVIIGATLEAIENISLTEKEVLRNSGKTFLRKYRNKLIMSQKTANAEKQTGKNNNKVKSEKG